MTMARAHPPLPGREAVRMESVRKVYGTGANAVVALEGVTIGLAPATFTAVMGPSGSGKSTLLQVAAGLDRPTEGRVYIDGTEMDGRDETQLTRFRRRRIGFVFQQLNLPADPHGPAERHPAAAPGPPQGGRLVRQGDPGPRRPGRAAGAPTAGAVRRRAAARRDRRRGRDQPERLFADEPTGALDTRSAREVLALLREAVGDLGQTVVMVTHDPVAAASADSVLFLADGRIVGRLDDPTAEAVAERMAHLGDEVAGYQSASGGE